MLKPGTIILASIDNLWLCPDLDCKCVSNQSGACPLCGSHVQSLANVLDRPEEVKAEEA
jgi:hypothetical protein